MCYCYFKEQIMDQKIWLEVQKSFKNSISMENEAEFSIKGTREEKLPYAKEVVLEETVRNLHKHVAYLLCECNAKDRLVAEHAKAAQEANAGRERAEVLVATQKQELEDVLQQKVAAKERLVHLNTTLTNCRQQLSSLKVEQHQKVNLKREHKKLETKYSEARKKLANLTLENAQLSKVLVKKEEIMKNVSNQISEAKEEFNELFLRLDSTERGSHVLKYEYRLLEKQLKMRSRHVDVANRRQLDAERQKLRLLVKKRAPCHSKAKATNHPKAVERRMSLMIKQLCEVEEENKILRENSYKKENEIHHLKVELARMSSNKRSNGKLSMSVRNDHDEMAAKLLESDKKIVCLKTELECLKESKITTEDHLENLKLLNYDLDNQLSTAKLKMKEAFQKVFFIEMELEDKSHHCEDLEATCLELQLQLASFSAKDEVTGDLEQEGKPLETVLEMTANSTNTNSSSHSLRDQMAAEDGVDAEYLIKFPTIKDNISTTGTKESSVPCYNTCNTLNKVKNIIPRTLPIVPSKKRRKGIALLKKLLFRTKREGNKKKLLVFSLHKI